MQTHSGGSATLFMLTYKERSTQNLLRTSYTSLRPIRTHCLLARVRMNGITLYSVGTTYLTGSLSRGYNTGLSDDYIVLMESGQRQRIRHLKYYVIRVFKRPGLGQYTVFIL